MKKWLVVSLLLAVAGCNLPKDAGFNLGVPFRHQVSYNYCGAASVLMWRLFDGLDDVGQATIYNWMSSYSPYCGSNQAGIAAAVRYFTLTPDAYWDFAEDTEFAEITARQITSMDARVPVIAVVDYDHTVVVNGGKWHEEGELNVWDFVYYHDPAQMYGANFKATATDWQFMFCPGYWGTCDQIISGAAATFWGYNLQQYGDSVVAAGGGRPIYSGPLPN